MAGHARVLSVLIASPGDVPLHRAALADRFEMWNRGAISKRFEVVLQVLRWEHNAVSMLGAGDAQQVINRQLVDDADVVVAVFHARLGRPTERHESGTAEEIAVGLARRIPVHVYVDTSPPPDTADVAQRASLRAYLEGLRAQGLIIDVSGKDELIERVMQAVEHDIVEVMGESGGLGDAIEAAATRTRQRRTVELRAALLEAALEAWHAVESSYGVAQDQGGGTDGPGRHVACYSPLDLTTWEDVREEYRLQVSPAEFKTARELFEALHQMATPLPGDFGPGIAFAYTGDWVDGCHAVVIALPVAEAIARGRLPEKIREYADVSRAEISRPLERFPKFWRPHPSEAGWAIPIDWQERYATGYYQRHNEPDGRAKPIL